MNSVDSLLNALRRSELLAPEQIEQIVQELVPVCPDAESILRYLVEIDWLTVYQSNQLLSRRGNELTFGPYQILDLLVVGGNSDLFKAWDTHHGREVVIKVLRRELSVDPDYVARFQSETQILAQLNHPHIIKLFDTGALESRPYYVMEKVEGGDLEAYVRRNGPLSIERACELGRQAALALQHIHSLGVIHGDIRPAHLLVSCTPSSGADSVLKIIDWSAARLIADIRPNNESNDDIENVDYIAPEMFAESGRLNLPLGSVSWKIDIRADLYSLGAVLYFLLTGLPPFKGGTTAQKIAKHRQAPPPSVRDIRPEVSVELDELIKRLLAKSPDERPRIPLLIVNPLRKLASGAMNATGSDSRASIPALRPSVSNR